MSRDIKQRKSHIKDIKKLDHIVDLNRKLHHHDIKTKSSVNKEEKNESVQSNESYASDCISHSAKKVAQQELYGAMNIRDKGIKIKAMRELKKDIDSKNNHKTTQHEITSVNQDTSYCNHPDSRINPNIRQKPKDGIKRQEIVRNHEVLTQKQNHGNHSQQKADIKTRDSIQHKQKQKNQTLIKQSYSQKHDSTSSKISYLQCSPSKMNTRIKQNSFLRNRPIISKDQHSKIPFKVKVSASKKMPEKNIFNRIASSMKKVAKATIKTFQSLTMLLSLGGSMVVFILILIVSVCIIISSPFSIFFSNDTENENETLQHAITEVNQEYTKQIRELKKQYDDVSQTITLINNDKNIRMREVWQNVLLIYTIQTYDETHTSFYFDEQRTKQLQEVFFQIININGSLTKHDKENILLIEVTMKSYQDYPFSNDEREMLQDLLDGKNDYLWDHILDGISVGNGNMVETALSQVGNVGGKPFWSWYGFTSRVEWCACFVSWVAEQNGYIDTGVIPKFASVEQEGIPWFKKRNQWEKRGYVPSPGDIIFFDWDGDDHGDHVGLVERNENGIIHTIEGNSLDECRQREYPINSNYILGYGIPDY